jgi:hypothetical protein
MRLVMDIQYGSFTVDSIGDDTILPEFPWKKIRVWCSRYVAGAVENQLSLTFLKLNKTRVNKYYRDKPGTRIMHPSTLAGDLREVWITPGPVVDVDCRAV